MITTLYAASNLAMFVPPLILSIYNIILGNPDTSKWTLPLTMESPISTESIWGWYFMWLIQILMGIAYIIALTVATSYFVCCCLYIGAICDHFTSQMRSVRGEIERNLGEKNQVNYRKGCIKIKEKLHIAIEIHVKVYE